MDASIVDLRYRMNDVLKAVKRQERVNIFERNRLIGFFIPAPTEHKMRVKDHPFFGSAKEDERPVRETLRVLRKNRQQKKPV